MAVSEKSLKNLQQKGRPKGSKNKLTLIKDAFATAFDDLGGVEGLVKWAKADNGKNQGEFYKLLVKLLPKEELVRIEDLNAKDIRHDHNNMSSTIPKPE